MKTLILLTSVIAFLVTGCGFTSTSPGEAVVFSRFGDVAPKCYPAGFYDPAIEEMVRASGYLNATTTRWDSDTSDMMALPRRRISGGTALDGFAWIVQS